MPAAPSLRLVLSVTPPLAKFGIAPRAICRRGAQARTPSITPCRRAHPQSLGFAKAGTAALPLHALKQCWPVASNGRLPRGVCLDGLPALVHSFFGEFLAIPPEVLPIATRPACGVHKASSHFVSTLPLQSFHIHSWRPSSPHLTGQELSKKRITKSLGTAVTNKFTKGRNLANPVNF